MGVEARRAASAVICAKIRALPAYRRANCVAAFAPMAEEVDIWPILEDAHQHGKTVALPRIVDAKARQIAFHRFLGQSSLVSGVKGIAEPSADSPPVAARLFDFLLVPAVAVGKDRTRVGYGGGFYDIFLSNPVGTPSFAPIFRCQSVNIVPREAHDQRVDFIITEE